MVKSQCFTKEWTDQLREKYPRTDPGLLEKTIHAFELLALLVRTGRPFVFKGGTALLLHLNDLDRLSIDIDIVGSFSKPELEASIKDSVFSKITEDIKAESHIPKMHFQFFYSSQHHQRNPYVLLDILEADNPYSKVISKPIDSDIILAEDKLTVSVPPLEALLGDKMTAFAPETIGIPYQSNKSMEIIKQLYDIGKLFDHGQDFNLVKVNHDTICQLESSFHDTRYTQEAVLRDTITTAYLLCQIDLRGHEENERTEELRQGVRQIQSHLLNSRFSLQDAKVAASKAAFLATAQLADSQFDPFESRFSSDKIESLRTATISGRNSILNRLKSSLPEAFYYWQLISQWGNEQE
jgi:hypothetical protein